MTSTRSWICAAALVAGAAFGVGTSAARAGDESPLTDEDRADLAWFEGLGYPKLGGLPFVRVLPGGNPEVRGFLLGETDARFRVLSLGVGTWDFERSPAGTPENRRIGFERLDAEDLADVWLVGGPSPTGPHRDFPDLGEPSVQTQILVLAVALSHEAPQRSDGRVHALLAHARTLQKDHWHTYEHPDDPWRPLHERAASDLAAVETFRAKTALAGSWLWGADFPRDRRGQLDAFRAVLRRFPGAREEAEVREFVAILERMLREDEEHARTAKPLDQLAGDDLVTELIFRLRSDTPTGFGAMGSPGPITGGPYKQLVALGHAAVPRLIDALADETLTNYGGEGRSGMNPYVVRLGAIAMMAIEEIAGRSFAPPEGTKIEPYDAVAWRVACRPAIEAWLADVKSGGEVASLVRAVEAGDWSATQAAKTLLARDAAKLPAALVRGIAASKHLMIRASLIELLAKHPGDVGRDLLLTEGTSGDPWTRLTAAKLLADAGDAAAADLLLALWRERRDGGGPPTWVADGSTGRDRDDELRTIARALLATRRADLVTALADDLPRRCPAVRRVLVQELARARPGAAEEGGDVIAAAIDAAFASVLDDREEFGAERNPSKPVDGLALRVCDVAAAAIWPTRGIGQPRIADPLWARDAAIAVLANARARARGLPERPLVELPPLGAVDAADVRARIDALMAAPFGSDARRERLRDVEALGLAALPLLRMRLADPALGYAQDLVPVVGRLAFTIRAMRILPAGAVLPDALRAKLEALGGAPLTATAVGDAAWTMIRSTGDAMRGASLDVYRGTGDDGVVVTLTLQDGMNDSWELAASALHGDRHLVGVLGSSVTAPADDPDLLMMIEQALAAPPGQRSWIHVRMARKPARD